MLRTRTILNVVKDLARITYVSFAPVSYVLIEGDNTKTMRSIEVEAKTSQEAIKIALEKLGVPKQRAKVKILTEGHKGLFGLEGTRQAKVRVTVEEERR